MVYHRPLREGTSHLSFWYPRPAHDYLAPLMAEIPEHLLRRSKERRAALSGEAPPEGGEAPAAAAAGPAEAKPAAAPATAAAPALPTVAPQPQQPAVADIPPARARLPYWVAPLFAALPIFGILYAQGYQPRPVEGPTDPLVLGAEIYRSAGCSGCHGGGGEGGVGPKLNEGEVLLSFPDEQEHIDWVRSGSAPLIGQPYNARGRVAAGGMPGFGNLSDEELEAVVLYEREEL
jgi:mono/diheme cytochrome c family protein